MLGRLRFRLLRLGLLFAAQGTSERPNELLTSKPVGHHPLKRTANPLLILTNQINRGLCLAHALRGFECCVSPDVTSLEPAIWQSSPSHREPCPECPRNYAHCLEARQNPAQASYVVWLPIVVLYCSFCIPP